MKNRLDTINEVLDEFDFEKVHSVMGFLDWRWRDEFPSKADLKRCSRRLLESSYDSAINRKEGARCGTGGFYVTSFFRHDNSVGLELSFVLEYWTSDF